MAWHFNFLILNVRNCRCHRPKVYWLYCSQIDSKRNSSLRRPTENIIWSNLDLCRMHIGNWFMQNVTKSLAATSRSCGETWGMQMLCAGDGSELSNNRKFSNEKKKKKNVEENGVHARFIELECICIVQNVPWHHRNNVIGIPKWKCEWSSIDWLNKMEFKRFRWQKNIFLLKLSHDCVDDAETMSGCPFFPHFRWKYWMSNATICLWIESKNMHEHMQWSKRQKCFYATHISIAFDWKWWKALDRNCNRIWNESNAINGKGARWCSVAFSIREIEKFHKMNSPRLVVDAPAALVNFK